ncbi:MAG: hypothetical protein LAT61_07115 [Alcanivorax sp.]|nr:hypothetical protein [Alcanivorax sp.]
MKLVVLLVVLALRRLDMAWPQAFLGRERFAQMLAPWRARVDDMGLPPALAPIVRWLLLVLVPVIVVALLMCLLHNVLWGLPGFIAGGVLLLWLLGAESEFRQQEDLLARGRMNDPDEFAETAERHFGVDEGEYGQEHEQEHEYEAYQEPVLAGPAQPGYFARLYRRILRQDALQLFATVFWLIALGYWAALLYVLNLTLVRDENTHGSEAESEPSPARLLHMALFWMPSRLLVLCLALAGNFGRVADAVSGRVWRLDDGEALLGKALEGALDKPAPDASTQDQFQAGVDRLEELQGVLLRCLAIWLILAAVWIVTTG